MKGRYNRILQAIFQSPWAILPEKLDLIIGMIEARRDGTAADSSFKGQARRPRSRRANSSIAVLPLYGTIVQRADVMMDFSGGTSTLGFARTFRQVLADPSVVSVMHHDQGKPWLATARFGGFED